MKRMIAFIFIVVMMLGIAYFKDAMPKAESFERAVIVSDFGDLDIQGEILKNGKDFYYYVDYAQCKIALNRNGNDKIKGIVYYYNKNLDLNYFTRKFNYSISDKTTIEDRDVYYGYDEDYYDFRFISGKKINFQLAYDGNNWILGYPMIITGF